MIYYLDTSALVKRYYSEAGSSWVHSLFVPDNILVASRVAYAELLAALARKRRVREVTERGFTSAVDSFQHEWQECVVVEVSDAVVADLLALVQRHALRGFDAIHLYSALWFRQRTKADLTFVSADHQSLRAAEDEGIEIANPERMDTQ